MHGRFRAGSTEADQRRQLYNACPVGGDHRDSEGDYIVGQWQVVRIVSEGSDITTTKIEWCVRFENIPGSVKCVVSEYDGEVNVYPLDSGEHSVILYGGGEKVEEPVVEGSHFIKDFTSVDGTLWTGQDYQDSKRLCNLFGDFDID